MDKLTFLISLFLLCDAVASHLFNVQGMGISYFAKEDCYFVEGFLSKNGEYKGRGALSHEECENGGNKKLEPMQNSNSIKGMSFIKLGCHSNWTKGFVLCLYNQTESGDYKVSF